MMVYNLKDYSVDYKHKLIPAYGFADYPKLAYIPDRDKKLATLGILAFGSRPVGWAPPRPMPAVVQAEKALKVMVDHVDITEQVKEVVVEKTPEKKDVSSEQKWDRKKK